MDETKLLHWLVDSGLLPIIGLIGVYLFREIYKDRKFQKIREDQQENFTCRFLMKNETDLDKFTCKFREDDHEKIKDLDCHFRIEDHARIGEGLMITKTNEVFIKEIITDNTKIVNSLERIIDKFEDVARELRMETNQIKHAMQNFRKK